MYHDNPKRKCYYPHCWGNSGLQAKQGLAKVTATMEPQPDSNKGWPKAPIFNCCALQNYLQFSFSHSWLHEPEHWKDQKGQTCGLLLPPTSQLLGVFQPWRPYSKCWGAMWLEARSLWMGIKFYQCPSDTTLGSKRLQRATPLHWWPLHCNGMVRVSSDLDTTLLLGYSVSFIRHLPSQVSQYPMHKTNGLG